MTVVWVFLIRVLLMYVVIISLEKYVSYVFGYRYNQLPRLIEQPSQWLSGPSPLLSVAAGPPADYPTGFKLCSDAQQFLFNYWHRLTKNA
jgi:hypothetical protein